MAGLLDGFTMPDMDSPQGQGLLAAAFNLMGAKGNSLGNAIGSAGRDYLATYGTARNEQEQRALAKLQREKYVQDMEAAKQRAQQEAAAMEAAVRKQAALPGIFTGGQQASPAIPAAPVDTFLPPEMRTGASTMLPATPARAETKMGIDIQKALAAGFTPEEIQKLDALRNVGMDEVARTMTGMQGGREVAQQFDKFGRPVGQGLEQYRAPIEVNTNAKKLLLDPYSRSPLSTFAMEQSPDSKASNAVAWANNALSRERLSFDKAGGAEGGKPQLVDGQWVYKPDFQNPNGRVVPIQGLAPKPMTDSQSKANLFGTRAMEAEAAIQSLKGKADRPGWTKRTAEATVGMVPFAGDKLAEVAGSALNWTQSDEQQQVEQAQRNFINAVLRRESGAVIGADEFTNAGKQYFPKIGDSDAVLAQKAKNRKTAIDGILAEVPAGNRPLITPPTSGTYSDPSKESRYQAWKRQNGG